ncbi:MAG: Murein peptide amidase A [Syntrophus sp. SKADARSKE-3]|nr:Murein peptide amidase A [Syntrophus sp. SKADARSKE-3]
MTDCPGPKDISIVTWISPLIIFMVVHIVIFGFSGQSHAGTSSEKALHLYLTELEKKCIDLGWPDIQLAKIPWQYYRTTVKKKPLIFAQFGESKSNCTMFLGGVHGDETPTVYLMLKLANYIKDNPLMFKDKCIIIAPLVNPDGFFAMPSKRVNANGVDINRNFPTKDWSAKALQQWAGKYKKSARYNPGRRAGSEQETNFQIAMIKRFKPQKILSVHSPLGLYDYDGPSSDLDSFEHWLDVISKQTNHPMKKFGCFPGSLGNYAGLERKIFTLTLELSSSQPAKGKIFFSKFQPMIIQFLDLPIDSTAPYIKIDSVLTKHKTRS